MSQPQEERINVRSYSVRYRCDKPCDSMLAYTGVALLSHPAQYQHKCVRCGKIYDTPKVAGSVYTEETR